MTLFASILFSVFTSAMFFIKGQFFSGSGSSDLLSYFSYAPYICIIVIPCLAYKSSISIYDDFIPLSRLKKILKNFFRIFINFTFIVLMMLPVCLLVNLFGSVDSGQIFSSIICLLLYAASLISLCIFINEILTNNIAAFALSALLLALFNSIHLLPLYLSTPKLISIICQKLSFAWHFDAASKGILDSRDLLWLILWTAFFITAAFYTQELKKGLRLNKSQITFSAGLLLFFIFALANSNNYFFRLDLSKNKSYSVSKYTKKLIENLDDNLSLTYYRSGELSKLYPQIRDVSDYLNSFSVLNNNINLTIKDPDKDQTLQTMLSNYGISSQQIQSNGINSTQFINVYSALVLEYKGNIQLIPFLMSSQTLEYDLDIRIKNLITKKFIGVNILVANGMTLEDDYSFIIPWLNSQGLSSNILYIEDPAFIQNLEISSGPLLVIGDSQVNIDNAIAIENYILSGKGNAIFALNPYSAAIEDDWTITANARTNLVEMLENWGVTFTDKIAADISCARITMYSQDDSQENPFEQTSSYSQVLNYPLWPSLLPQEYCRLGMTLFWPVSLELSQNAMPYLVTSPQGFNYKTDRSSPSKLLETNPFYITLESAADKEKNTQIVGAQITGPLTGLYNLASCEDSNIIVISDQYFLNTLMTGYIGGDFGDYRNFEFISNCILNLNGENQLAALQSKTVRDSSLYKVSDLDLFVKYMRLIYAVAFIIIPLIFILTFVIQIILRNKRRIKINV